ncbi:bifunctional DNA primase/polymerase [Rosistilla oblonga]|uniref:bifunctional DNA primase/polymerase n=1 Tax=Rosistilla oblonga TaxID=2527990 RepID=UPI003A969BDA
MNEHQRPPRSGDLHSNINCDPAGCIAAGLSIIPLRLDGSKAPAIKRWLPYRQRFATPEELREWFAQPAGIGLVCGLQSGGLEVMDFDHEADATFAAWLERLPASTRGRLCVCETGGGGFHVLYRCREICGNCKVAMPHPNERQPKPLIETRGEGGYIVAVGSPAEVHSSGNLYAQLMGEPLPSVPTFSPDERKAMFVAAAALDRRPDPLAEFRRRTDRRDTSPTTVETSTPWGDFDARADWLDILQPAGWNTTDGITWTRPGKSFGTSGKIVNAENGVQVLTVFSSSAEHLAAEGVGHRTWGPFAAYAAINHGGDRRAAARAIRAMGYGGASK